MKVGTVFVALVCGASMKQKLLCKNTSRVIQLVVFLYNCFSVDKDFLSKIKSQRISNLCKIIFQFKSKTKQNKIHKNCSHITKQTKEMKTTFNNFWTAVLGIELKVSYMTGVNALTTEVTSIPALAGFGPLSTS